MQKIDSEPDLLKKIHESEPLLKSVKDRLEEERKLKQKMLADKKLAEQKKLEEQLESKDE